MDGFTYLRTGYAYYSESESPVFLHGPYFIYFSNGSVWQEGSFKYGEKDGLWKIHFAYDNPKVWEETLHRSRRTFDNYFPGTWYNPDGEILTWKRWYAPGTQLEVDANYQTRLIREWHTNGVMRKYEDATIIKNWYESGNLEGLAPLSGGKLHGTRVVYEDSTNAIKAYEYVFRYGFPFKYRTYDRGVLYEEWEQAPMDDYPQYSWWHGMYSKFTKHHWLTQPNGQPVLIIQESGNYTKGNRCGNWLVLTNRDYNGFGLYRQDVYGSCSTAVTTPVYTNATVTNKEIRGVVYDAVSDKPLAGAAIVTDAGNTVSGEDGAYVIQVGAANSQNFVCTKPGYVTNKEAVNLTDIQSKTLNVNLSPIPPGPEPVITAVQSQYGLFGLYGIPWQNTFSVSVDWRGLPPGNVQCLINGAGTTINTTGTVGTFSLDMGSAFAASLWPKGNKLQLLASSGSQTSSPVVLYPYVPPIPTWSMQLGNFQTQVGENEVTFSVSHAFPTQAVDIKITQQTIGNTLWQAWSLIPVFGGRNLGFGGQFQVGAEAKTDGSGNASFGGTGDFEALGGTIQGRLTGKGLAQYDLINGGGLKLTGVDGIVGLKGTLIRTNKPTEIIPGLEAARNLPLVGRAVEQFNQWAKIIGTVSVDAEIATRLYGAVEGLTFQPYESSFTVGAELALAGELCENVKAIMKGSGQTRLTYQFPAKPGYLKSVEAKLGAQMQLVLWSYQHTFDATHTFTYPAASPAPLAALEAALPQPLGFRPISRDFQNAGDYNLFRGGRAAPAAPNFGPPPPNAGPLPPGGGSPTPLVQNVYPYSEPAMAVLSNQVALAYVISDLNDPVLQANEIYFTLYDGTNYTVPAPLLNDTRADFSPSLAFDDQARVVCAWQRVNATNFSGLDATNMAPELEIVYAAYDPLTSAWTPPVALTTNNVLDHTPILRRGFNGKIMLLWQTNPGNELMPSASHPSTFSFAFWDSVTRSFTLGGSLPGTFTNTVAHSLAYDGTNAVFVCVADPDGNFATSDDQEIYYQAWNGAVWTAATRVTSNNVPDLHPEVLYQSPGVPELVWLSGLSLARLTNWTTGEFAIIRSNSFSAAFNQFKLAADAQHRLLVLWQDYNGLTSDLLRNVYDPVQNVWSEDLAVTRDAPLERDFRAAFNSDGQLHLVYNVDATTNRTDLVHAWLTLGADAVINPEDLWLEPPNAAPGTPTTLHCRVRNPGDLALTNVQVAFHLGTSPTNGLFITNGTVSPALLRAGTTGEVTVAWVTPTNAAVSTIVATVDPGQVLAEISTTNNQALVAFARPDLAILGIRNEEHGDGSVTLTATVKNQGTTMATNIAVQFRVDERNLSQVNLSSLDAGVQTDVSAKVWADLFFTNRPSQLLITVDPDNQIAEASETNNQAARQILLTTDANGNGIEDSWERMFFGNQTVNRDDDADGDGFSNRAEYLAGTNPLDADSLLRVAPTQQGVPNNQLRFSWPTVSGVNYQVQYKDSLNAGEWQPMSGTNTLSGTNAERVETISGFSRRFYRIIIMEP
jgi:hypothetical protein